jgi:hypothetical protein
VTAEKLAILKARVAATDVDREKGRASAPASRSPSASPGCQRSPV